MKKEIRVLMLEDDIADAEMVKYALRTAGMEFSFQRVDSKQDFLKEIENCSPDVILSDSALPSFDGRAALKLCREKNPDVPFIFVTGTMGEEAAIETLKSGATDYVLKTKLSRLIPAVHRALREAEERGERRQAEEKLRASHEQLRALSVYLQYVREEERTRIAREVHDELGQALTGLKMDLSWIAGRLPRTLKPLQDKAKTILAQIDDLVQTVRRISTELRPGILDDLGLVAAIEWQANEFQIRSGIACRVTSSAAEAILDEELNTAFFRILQETLTNVIRHANATEVHVRLGQERGCLVLEVADNGRGILEAEINNTESIGLLGMRERASLLGGELSIRGQPGQGTTLTVSIPLTRAQGHGAPNHENPYRRRPRSSAARPKTNPGG